MRAFACDNCRSLIFFDNDRCFTCGHEQGYDRAAGALVSLAKSPLSRCANADLIGCNWLTDGGLCHCCALTRTRPADSDLAAMAAWRLTEAAKRRLVYQLDHLNLPTTLRADDPEKGLAFDLLSSARQNVITGHADGVITIDLAEGDDPHREALRVKLAEPYRTVLGHLRHEIGHWYWQMLVDGTPFIDRFRDLFGDERVSYSDALQDHYGKADDTARAANSWADTHVSHYAAAHPWEDWAETFAHYLHIRDTTETASWYGLRVDGPSLDLAVSWDAQIRVDPVEDVENFDELARSWIALKLVLNQLNRSMGKEDLYPFTLTPAVLDKLRFVHVVVTSRR